MADSELLRRNKPRLRFSKKVAAAILEEAVGSLSQARAAREQLEKLLRPHIDMASVEVAGDAVAAALLAL
ncbi:hypothetical protein SDC9_125927 [bioreactor metagenome]|uniref:Uncharacterized protein n=1 Tax=bioreactor metagenome TaxID=1076179 RepID=A0A645CQB6_9ZZZZ